MLNRMKYIRISNNAKQYQVAQRLNISESLYCRIERGQHTPTPQVKAKIEKMFSTKFEDLMKEPDLSRILKKAER